MLKLHSTYSPVHSQNAQGADMSRMDDHIGGGGKRYIRMAVHLLSIVHRDLKILLHHARRLSKAGMKILIVRAKTGWDALQAAAERIKSKRDTKQHYARRASDKRARPTKMPISDHRTPLRPKRVTSVPDQECIYAIGDIHGRQDLLLRLLDKIDEDIATLPQNMIVTLVFLGDYIDRGLQSRQVIDLILSERLEKYRTVYLIGNHEEALLEFRNDAYFGPKWVRYGGAETLISYGLKPPRGTSLPAQQAWHGVWQKFRDTLPEDHLEFYRSLKHYFTVGDYLFVHAGLRPDVPLEDQTVHDMLWIRDEFLTAKTDFPYLVVHGHTPTRKPHLDTRRLGLDTAAYTSGILTAARFVGTDISVITS